MVTVERLGPFLKVTGAALRRHGIDVPDRQLACAPLTPPRAGSTCARCGRPRTSRSPTGQALAHRARAAFQRALGLTAADLDMAVVYDVAHNIAKEEDHVVDGRPRRLLVHRCGRRSGPPHGAGRVLSRTAAVKAARGRHIERELLARGVVARATGRDALAEEMPEAYKDMQDVVSVVHQFGISTRGGAASPGRGGEGVRA